MSERQKVYLHIGAHKTGTTTIQYALAHSADALKIAGFVYPDAARFHYGHHRFAFGFTGRMDRTRRDRPDPAVESQNLRQAIAASRQPNAIVSSEELFALPEEAIAQIAETLREFDVKVIAYIRRQDRLFESIYNQNAKQPRGTFCEPYQNFLEQPGRLAKDLDFPLNLGRWENAFGRDAIDVRLYETPDLLTDFANACGLPEHALSRYRDRNLNKGLSQPALEIIRLAKTSKQKATTLERLFKLAEAYFPLAADDALLTPQERLDLLARYEEANRTVFDRYIAGECVYTVARAGEEALPEPKRLTLKMQNDFLCHLLAARPAAGAGAELAGAAGSRMRRLLSGAGLLARWRTK